jgi:hypothetical protein
MIYRGPGFPVLVRFDTQEGRLRKRGNLLTEEEGGSGRGAKSFDHKKAWSSIIYLILAGNLYGFYAIIDFNDLSLTLVICEAQIFFRTLPIDF